MNDKMLFTTKTLHLLVILLRTRLIRSDGHLAEWHADLVSHLPAEVSLVLRHHVVNEAPAHPHVLWVGGDDSDPNIEVLPG